MDQTIDSLQLGERHLLTERLSVALMNREVSGGIKMFRTMLISASLGGVLLPSQAYAQAVAPSDAAIAAEIQATEARVASLKRLAELRAEEAKLQAQLGVAPPAAAPIAQAPAPPAAAAPLVAAAPVAPGAVAAAPAPIAAGPFTPDKGGKQSFGGLEFGIGLAFTYDLGQQDRIKEAILDPNGIVRVSRSENLRARIVLESHYLFTPKGSFLFGLENVDTGSPATDKKTWGFGPFVALQPGTDNVIEAVGAGLMLGLKRPSEDPKSADSFNIGVGVMYDLNAQVLGDDIVANKPLPTGETEVRYKTQSQSGFLVMTSYSF